MDETGVAAAANDVYANPPDTDALELEPGHPGLGDEGYVVRRHELFAPCRSARLANEPPPLIAYTAEEQRIWREVTPKLDELHVQHASHIYLRAKRELEISEQEHPAVAPSQRLPAEGQRHAPGAGRRADPVPDVLPLHRRARLPVHAVHPARVEARVHARARHDPRLPGPRAAAAQPGLRGAAHADRPRGRRRWPPATRCSRSSGSAGSQSSSG